MKKQGLLWAGLFLFSTLGWAQMGNDSVCEINVTQPKPGSAKAFEEGRKKHNEFHKAEKDKHGISVWSITSGPATGSYLTATCGMAWKDFDGHDAMDQRDTADIERTMAPSIASNQSSYYVFRKDLSTDTGTGGAPAKMMTVVHYFVKPSGLVQFTESVKRINAAMAQTKFPAKPTRWYGLANGGQGPHLVAVTDRNSWADIQGPEQSMADMLKQAYGNEDKTLQTFRDAVDHTMSELMEYRADMSYVPAK